MRSPNFNSLGDIGREIDRELFLYEVYFFSWAINTRIRLYGRRNAAYCRTCAGRAWECFWWVGRLTRCRYLDIVGNVYLRSYPNTYVQYLHQPTLSVVNFSVTVSSSVSGRPSKARMLPRQANTQQSSPCGSSVPSYLPIIRLSIHFCYWLGFFLSWLSRLFIPKQTSKWLMKYSTNLVVLSSSRRLLQSCFPSPAPDIPSLPGFSYGTSIYLAFKNWKQRSTIPPCGYNLVVCMKMSSSHLRKPTE